MRTSRQKSTEGFEKISTQVLNGIVQSIEAAVVLHDRELKVVFVNDSFEKIFDIKGEDALGKSPMEFLPDFDKQHKDAIFSRLRNTLKTKARSKYHEFSYCSVSGRYRHLLAVSLPIFDNNGAITHVMSVIYDITRRKKLEQEAVKAAKLSSVADMAYTLAHEINNPLTGIRLGLATLYDSLKKNENIQVLDSVMKDLNRIQKTVHSFLKAKKEHSRLKKERFSIIEDIIEEVLFHLSGQLDLKKITIRKNLIKDSAYLLISRDGIHRALLNVFLNAIQATHQGGKIVISTEISPPKKQPQNNTSFLCLSLSDTGIGIDPKQREEIFEPFFSLKAGGTGLGLSICKNIVSAQDGLMEFESDVGKGTTVKIFIPVLSESNGNDNRIS
jgi:two-component system sporulation sensor kinase A